METIGNLRCRWGRAAALWLLAAAPVLPWSASAQSPVYDATGGRIGVLTGARAEGFAPTGLVRLTGGEADDGGTPVRFGAGTYVIGAPGAGPLIGATADAGEVNLFKDGTLEYFPLREWDLADVETGDLNGDGRVDMIFSLRWNNCDSIPGTRPRVWMQNAAGRFVDETDARIPAMTTSTFDLDLFDADGDGDLDVFLGGYGCAPVISPGAILINNGAGVFTDESAQRLLGVPEFTFINFATQAPIDSGSTPDIAAVLTDTRQNLGYPYLFLNDGTGRFFPDVFGRMGNPRAYGYFDVEASDLTGDGLTDLLFMNIAYPLDGFAGGPALFVNAGNGFFADETPQRLGEDTLRSVRDAAIGDADGDGDPDIVEVGWYLANNDPQLRLLANDGGGLFTHAAAGSLDTLGGWFNDAELFPFSQDSLRDLFLAKIVVTSLSPDVLLVNRGGGNFRDSSQLLPSVLDFSTAASTFDCDGDGDFDIAVGNSSPIVDETGQNRLYINLRRTPTVGVDEAPPIPGEAALLGNYPNPFNPSTVIRFRLAAPADISLTAVNVLGETVLLRDLGRRGAGTHEFRWDAAGLPGGVYWYSLHADGRRVSTRAAVLSR